MVIASRSKSASITQGTNAESTWKICHKILAGTGGYPRKCIYVTPPPTPKLSAIKPKTDGDQVYPTDGRVESRRSWRLRGFSRRQETRVVKMTILSKNSNTRRLVLSSVAAIAIVAGGGYFYGLDLPDLGAGTAMAQGGGGHGSGGGGHEAGGGSGGLGGHGGDSHDDGAHDGGPGDGGHGSGGQGAGGQGSGGQGAGNQGGAVGPRGDDPDSDGRGPQYGKPGGDQGGKPVWAQEGIPAVELGRLNVIRSPDHVLARALAEVLVNFDPDTTAYLYEMDAFDFAQEIKVKWDEIAMVDSPLENLALLEELWSTGSTSLPTVDPASQIDLAAILIGCASDKNIPVSDDTVIALASIVGVDLTHAAIDAIALKAEEVRIAVLEAHG